MKKDTILSLQKVLGLVEPEYGDPTVNQIAEGRKIKNMNKMVSYKEFKRSQSRAQKTGSESHTGQQFGESDYGGINVDDSDSESSDEYNLWLQFLDGSFFTLREAATFPVRVFAILFQSVFTRNAVKPSQARKVLTNGYWAAALAFWVGLIFLGSSLAFFQKTEKAVMIVLVPVLLIQFLTILYVRMRPELSSRIPVREKMNQDLCCGLIKNFYSSVNWNLIYNYWEPILPFVEFFQIIAVTTSGDMVEYWSLASESSFFNQFLFVSVSVLNTTILFFTTITYFIGIGIFIHFGIDPATNFGYVIYELIPGSAFLTVSGTALNAVKNGSGVEAFAGYFTLALYSSTAIYVTIYRFHEKWFADIYYTPTWLAMERIIKQMFAVISVYAFGNVRLKIGLAIVTIFFMLGVFIYMKPCSKMWLIFFRSVMIVAGLLTLFGALIAIDHGEDAGLVFLYVFYTILGVLLAVHTFFHVKQRCMMDIHIRMNEEAIREREIGQMSRQRMIEQQAKQYTQREYDENDIRMESESFSCINIESEQIIEMLGITNLSNDSFEYGNSKTHVSKLKPKLPSKAPPQKKIGSEKMLQSSPPPPLPAQGKSVPRKKTARSPAGRPIIKKSPVLPPMKLSPSPLKSNGPPPLPRKASPGNPPPLPTKKSPNMPPALPPAHRMPPALPLTNRTSSRAGYE